MIGLIFSGITLSAGFMAMFVGNMRHAILALWVAGLGVGAVYLTLGAELLAIVQWIVSTVVTISFVFFAVMFGEYNDPSTTEINKKRRKGTTLLLTLLSLVLGAGFAVVIRRVSKDIPHTATTSAISQGDLRVIGRLLTQENLLSLEVLALTLFLVLVGGGVVTRLEGEDRT